MVGQASFEHAGRSGARLLLVKLLGFIKGFNILFGDVVDSREIVEGWKKYFNKKYQKP